MEPVRDNLGFPANPSIDDVRMHLNRRLLPLKGQLRVGAVGVSDRNTIFAEVLDPLDTAVIFVEVDQRTGETLQML